jgi:hypothetical protein
MTKKPTKVHNFTVSVKYFVTFKYSKFIFLYRFDESMLRKPLLCSSSDVSHTSQHFGNFVKLHGKMSTLEFSYKVTKVKQCLHIGQLSSNTPVWIPTWPFYKVYSMFPRWLETDPHRLTVAQLLLGGPWSQSLLEQFLYNQPTSSLQIYRAPECHFSTRQAYCLGWIPALWPANPCIVVIVATKACYSVAIRKQWII